MNSDVFSFDESGIAIKYSGSGSTASFPEGTRGIEGGLFFMDDRIEEVTIPASVTSIGIGVFYGCDNLKRVVFKEPKGWRATIVDRDPFTGESDTVILEIPEEQLADCERAALNFSYKWVNATLERN